MESESEGEGIGALKVRAVLEDSDAGRRGLQFGDELVSFAGRPMTSVNQFKNVLGIYPKGWRLPLVFRRENKKHEILVRLMKLRRDTQENRPNRPGRRPPTPPTSSPAAKLYEPRPGFANYYFNKLEQERLLTAFRKHGDFAGLIGTWTMRGQADARARKSDLKIVVGEEAETEKDGKPIVRAWTYHLKPNTLPRLPEKEKGEEESKLRQVVRAGMAVMLKHAESLPQEIWAKSTPAETKAHAAALRDKAKEVRKEVVAALGDIRLASSDREKESRLWQANYDYVHARLAAFCAYVIEYEYRLAQLAGDNPPPRDPKKHRGWRLTAVTKTSSGPEAAKLLDEAREVWRQMQKLYNGTVWADRAAAGNEIQVGLDWQPATGTKTIVKLMMGSEYSLDPLKLGQDVQVLMDPPGSGGLMTALYQYRRFLTQGSDGFEGGFFHGGIEPVYPPPLDGSKPKSLADLRVDAEVIQTEHAAVTVKWYFSLKDKKLIAFETYVDPNGDPCEVYLSDYKDVGGGRQLPHRFDIVHGNNAYGTLSLSEIKFEN
ncbi:MAG: hypothetical protein KatS3mg105_2175 [Gemmatales bacterium]|nr:MAG: hypothetical protein KatS3mg105_2175 [Gemmatales bacterium]